MRRQSLLPRVLSVTEGSAVCRKPFKPPCSNGYCNQNVHLARRLWARKRFIPWGSSKPALVEIRNHFNVQNTVDEIVVEESVTLPPGVEPLILWQSEEFENGAASTVQIVVDPLLVRFLRPHQRCVSRHQILHLYPLCSYYWNFKCQKFHSKLVVAFLGENCDIKLGVRVLMNS